MQVIVRMLSKLCWSIFARQIPGADEEGESLRPGVVGGFALGLDAEVAVFHG